MRKFKEKGLRVLMLLLALALPASMLFACNGSETVVTDSPVPEGKPSVSGMPGKSISSGEDIDNSETEIGVMQQEYGDSETVEILMIKYDGSQPQLEEYGGKHPEIEMINNLIKAELNQLYLDYQDGLLELDTEPNGIEILSYPFADEEFLQIVTTTYVYPETRPDLYTRLYSYCFSKTENRFIGVDEMLEEYELDKDDLGKAFETHYEPSDGEMVTSLEVTGFLINRVPAKPVTHFLMEVMMETESDPYMCFFMYTPDNDELEELDPNLLFDPDVYDMLSMEPPLRYEQESDENGGSGSNGGRPAYSGTSRHAGYRVTMNTDGFETINKNCDYRLDSLYASMHAYAPSNEYYDEASMTARIRGLEDVTRVITVTQSEEHSALLTYPAWLLVYEANYNGNTHHCTDVYFQTDTAEYRVHTDVPVSMRSDYHDEVGARLATIGLVEDGTNENKPDDEITDTTDEPIETDDVDESIIGGEDDAMDYLSGVLAGRLSEGVAIVSYGDGMLDGEHCWLFAVGMSSEEKFTAEEHYAVTHDARVYILDIFTNEYVPL